MGFYEDKGRGGFMSAIPPVTRNIIIINVLVMVMTTLNKQFMYETFSLFYPTSPYFRFWQPVTHMFMHGGFWHLFFNMYTLLIFGSVLEQVWGGKKYLLFYFVTGIGAAALHTGVQWMEAQRYMAMIAENPAQATAALHALKMTPTVGASGAIYGLLLGYAMLFPDSVLTLVFPPISLKAKWFVIIFAVIELVSGVSGGFGGSGGVAHFAHLGGMLFGWILVAYWKKRHKLYQHYD